MTKALHATEILQYAQDCQKYDKPWLLWQERSSFNNKEWKDCTKHLTWESNTVYRRKPVKVKIGDMVVDGPLQAAVPKQVVYGLFHGIVPFEYETTFEQHLLNGTLFESLETMNAYKNALISLMAGFEKLD